MEIKIKSPRGVKLLTEQKYCVENIDVVPELQNKTVTPTDAQQVVTPDAEYAGLGQVTVEPDTVTADATAMADDIRLGKTAYGATGKMTGTIADYDGSSEPASGIGDIVIPPYIKEIYSTYNDLTGVILVGQKAIRYNCFYEANALISVEMSHDVISIGKYAFYRCIALSHLILSNNIIDIKNNAFDSCALKNIVIPDKTEIIGTGAFNNCGSLTDATIGAGVSTIKSYIFQNCKKLSSVKMLPVTPPTLGSNVFNGTAADLQIIVPKGTLDAYKTATNWSALADKMVEATE